MYLNSGFYQQHDGFHNLAGSLSRFRGSQVALVPVVVHVADVGVGHLAGEADLLSEALRDLAVVRVEELGKQYLDGHLLVEHLVLGPEDAPHPALAQLHDQLEAVGDDRSRTDVGQGGSAAEAEVEQRIVVGTAGGTVHGAHPSDRDVSWTCGFTPPPGAGPKRPSLYID